MNPYIEIIRPNVCILSILGVIIGALVIGILGIYVALLLAIASAFLLCAAGDVINDFFDAEADRVNRPDRPIPSGSITPNKALYYYLALSIAGLAAAFFVSLPFFALAIFNFAVFTFYPWVLKRIPLIKNLAVAWLGSVSFLAAGFIIGINITTALWVLVATSFIVVVAREILKDIEDMKGDSMVGIRTLPMVAGQERSHVFAFVLLFIGCALLAVPFYFGIFGIAYLVGAVPAVLLCIYAAKRSPSQAQKIIKIAMYLVFLGFVLGALV